MSAGAGAPRRPTQRLPGLVNAGAAAAVLLLVLSLALRASQNSPPAIAEFAPQAQQIHQAPSEQTSTFGSGSGGAATAAAPSPSPAQAGVPAGAVLLHCVGDPPRQIEDPQSPPCIPYWAGNNGGTTSSGVSASEIRVAIAANEYAGNPTLMDDMLRFFNLRFELYGRKLVYRQYTPTQPCYAAFADARSTGPCGTDADMQADAGAVAADHDFADLGYSVAGNGDGTEYYFYDQLAQRHILSVQFTSHAGATFADESHFDQYAPYEWNYLPAFDRTMSTFGGFLCAQLAHRPPQYAGPPQNTQATRVFGLVVEKYAAGLQPNLSPLLNEASACGVSFTTVNYDPNATSQTGLIVQLSSAHVTSVLCLCNNLELARGIMPAATSQGYYPEWLITNYGMQDDDFEMGYAGPHDQTAHMFGLMGFNKWLPAADRPLVWALNEVDPGQCPQNCNNWEVWAVYWELLVLASGVQMGGPDLTAASVQSGLYRTAFPNPGCGGPPWYQACVGFGPHDHTMIQDYAMAWWSNTAYQAWAWSGQPPTGTYCYVNLGTRLRSGWPTAPQAFFDPRAPCR